jgi:hypothetical protein
MVIGGISNAADTSSDSAGKTGFHKKNLALAGNVTSPGLRGLPKAGNLK